MGNSDSGFEKVNVKAVNKRLSLSVASGSKSLKMLSFYCTVQCYSMFTCCDMVVLSICDE